MIKAIIFDCFGVLTADTWLEFCRTLPQETIDEVHNLNSQRGAGTLTRKDFVNKLVEVTGQRVEVVSEASMPGGAKNSSLLSYIRELKLKNYKIGLISNVGSNWIRDEFLTPDEQELFDTMVMSYEAGITKPDSRIFTIASGRLRVTPEEAVMIDDIDTYVEAARAVGMQGIVYKGFEQMKTELEELLNTKD